MAVLCMLKIVSWVTCCLLACLHVMCMISDASKTAVVKSSQLKRVSSLSLAHDVGACTGVVPHLGAHLAELCSIEGEIKQISFVFLTSYCPYFVKQRVIQLTYQMPHTCSIWKRSD